MLAKIFISYRRDDTEHAAGRLFNRLEHDFSRTQLFMDVDIKPGSKFPDVLDDELRQCRALLAVIGPNWVNAKDKNGQRRLDDPEDFVRQEISAAIRRDIAIFPVLVGGATMPRAEDLPEPLKPLSERQGILIRSATFDPDVTPIVKAIKGAIGPTFHMSRLSAMAAAVILTLGVCAYLFLDGSMLGREQASLQLVDLTVIDEGPAIKEFAHAWLPNPADYTPEMSTFKVDDTPERSTLKGSGFDLGSGLHSGRFPILDIKLLNSGQATVFVKRIDFNVLDVTGDRGVSHVCNVVAVSRWYGWYYNVSLGPKHEFGPDLSKINLSQAIKPGDTDRFAIVVGSDELGSLTYTVQATLYFNRNESLPLGTYNISVRNPDHGCGGSMDAELKPEVTRLR